MKYRTTDPHPPHKAWTLVLASLAVFMTALDTLVVTTALPVLRVDLHASLAGLEWTVNAYNLSFACLLLTGAALGDRFGRRRMFTIGLGMFTVASAASALAPSVQALVFARALQGAGAAIVAPLTLTLTPRRSLLRSAAPRSGCGAGSSGSRSPPARWLAARSSPGSTGTGSSGSTFRSVSGSRPLRAES
jgi:MFS family permease